MAKATVCKIVIPRFESGCRLHFFTFFNLDWANSSAVCFVCDGCGNIDWFLPQRWQPVRLLRMPDSFPQAY